MTDDLPDFATLAADPEIAALLDFDPVPRQRQVEGCWTPELQREFIARLAVIGSPGTACEEMGKSLSGMRKLYRSPYGASFRAACDGAVALAKRRQAEQAGPIEPVRPVTRPPSLDLRRKYAPAAAGPAARGEGQVLNEHGQWEDEASLHRRADALRDSFSSKLLQARRLYLHEISASAGKRAAFEILTELPIDWEKAERLEPQPDEPWRKPNMRRGDMLLTAENGWMGEIAHGPDKKAELMKAVDEYRAAEGMAPVEWDEQQAEAGAGEGGDA